MKRFQSIRTFVGLWAGSVFVALAILGAGGIIGSRAMFLMQERVLIDASGLDTSRLLELAILGERREDLLWRATQDDRYKAQGDAQVSAGKFSLRRSRVELTNVMRRLTEESAAGMTMPPLFPPWHNSLGYESDPHFPCHP